MIMASPVLGLRAFRAFFFLYIEAGEANNPHVFTLHQHGLDLVEQDIYSHSRFLPGEPHSLIDPVHQVRFDYRTFFGEFRQRILDEEIMTLPFPFWNCQLFLR